MEAANKNCDRESVHSPLCQEGANAHLSLREERRSGCDELKFHLYDKDSCVDYEYGSKHNVDDVDDVGDSSIQAGGSTSDLKMKSKSNPNTFRM